MPEVEILLSGYTFNSDQTRLGLSTVALIRGERLTVVDVSHFGRRNLLVEQLQSRGIALEAVERVILTTPTGTTPRTRTSSPTPRLSSTPRSWHIPAIPVPTTSPPPDISPKL